MGHGQPLAPRSAGLSDDALPRLGSPQSSKSCRERPRASAHALPGSPVPFATALSPAAATSPLLRSPFQTLDATPTRPSPRSATTRRQNGNPHYQHQACDRIFGIDRLGQLGTGNDGTAFASNAVGGVLLATTHVDHDGSCTGH